ncbi:MAG TPA: hypothetical protein VD838_17920, partial [Anaeromyxobacteraceae bacterium]|nr:hypothetical protein [Anaeromyxobacteraceae bacterium]
RALASLWLVAALGATVGIFAAPGTGMNHLAELQAAGMTTLGVLASSRAGAAATLARAGAATAAVAGLVVAIGLLRADLSGSRLAAARAALADAPRAFGAPILSEDPLVPILAGERPILLDPFMHRIAAERDGALADRLAVRIAAGEFAAVILLADAAGPDADAWYGRIHLGSGPLAAIRDRYRLVARHPPYHVYLPAALPGAEGDAQAARAP